MRRSTCWLAVLLAGAAPIAAAQPAAAPWGLTDLMHELAQVQSASGRFTERKTIHLLDAPLIASGTLRYVAPDYLAKQTISPAPESFVLDHGEAAIAGANRPTQRFPVADNPEIAGLIDGVRATLAGDLPALARSYTVRLTGGDASWQLELRPRDAALTHLVTWIVVLGCRDRITAIDTASANGDHSEMGIVEDTIDAR